MNILNERQAAQYLNISHSHLNWLRRRGEGPEHFNISRAVRYRVADLDAWVDMRIIRKRA